MIPAWSQLANLGAALAFILALKALSSPKTARLGNRIGAVGAIAAVAIVFFSESNLKHLPLILIAVAFGTIVGFVAAKKVQMTQMPQMVALFNGVGGGAAMAVSSIEFLKAGATDGFVALFATVFTVVIGSISFTGSIVTFLKLQELMTSRPVVLPLGRFITIGTALATLVMSVYLMIFPEIWALWTLVALSLVMGILFVLPVGGADVPIVISLLNAFTGLSVAASGYVLDNVLLLVAGTLVGASGTLLTQLMAKAMGRPLTSTLFGAFTAKASTATASAVDRPVKSAGPTDIAIMLTYATKVIIAPGYGLAVAQAQQQLKEMDEINSEFSNASVAVVVGANDVVNPAARTDKSSPIFGMPILNADQAEQVVFMKRSMRPGFAGVENELLFNDKTTLLFGDAKDSLSKVVAAVKSM